MPKHLRVLTFLALSLPFAAWAEVPVYDGVAANNGGNVPPSGYGTAGAGGAFAGGGVTTPTSVQGELFMQLQQMQDELARLRGTLEEQQNQIQQLKQESLERYQDLDRRISGGGAPAAQNSAPAGAINANGAPAAPAGNNAPAPSSEPGDPAKEKLYYDAAFDLIKSKDFDKASQAFGEVNLAKGDLQGAGQAFARVSQSYPSSQKVPDSLYKLADVERRLGNNDKAKGILQQVISQYPGTSAAQLAQRDLKNLR